MSTDGYSTVFKRLLSHVASRGKNDSFSFSQAHSPLDIHQCARLRGGSMKCQKSQKLTAYTQLEQGENGCFSAGLWTSRHKFHHKLNEKNENASGVGKLKYLTLPCYKFSFPRAKPCPLLACFLGLSSKCNAGSNDCAVYKTYNGCCL